jgi:hypothetical protein
MKEYSLIRWKTKKSQTEKIGTINIDEQIIKQIEKDLNKLSMLLVPKHINLYLALNDDKKKGLFKISTFCLENDYPKCCNCRIKLIPTEDIPHPLFCCLDCKKEFYKNNYLGSCLASSLEYKHKLDIKKQANENNKKFCEWKKKTGKTKFTDYLKSFGKFKKEKNFRNTKK